MLIKNVVYTYDICNITGCIKKCYPTDYNMQYTMLYNIVSSVILDLGYIVYEGNKEYFNSKDSTIYDVYNLIYDYVQCILSNNIFNYYTNNIEVTRIEIDLLSNLLSIHIVILS